MFTASNEDVVSNIHRRWSFTKINPSSYKQSFAISLACAAIIELFSHIFYLHSSSLTLALCFIIGFVAFLVSFKLDQRALHGTPVNKFSKIAHVSAFSSALWAFTILIGFAADIVFSKQSHGSYIISGMLLAVGLRIGIFASVFGASLGRAVPVSFIQPLLFSLAFIAPSNPSLSFFLNPPGLVFGFAFITLGTIWAIIADRAGRPNVKSTFGLLQAFLAAWSENKADQMEEFMEQRAHQRDDIFTKIIRFNATGDSSSFKYNPQHHLDETTDAATATAIVLPDVHPGPFSMVGGSNLPFLLYEAFSKKALIMHSISDHSLNIPSKREVARYIRDIGNIRNMVEKGKTCSPPVQVAINNARSTGIAFGNTALLTLSLAPVGMEDVPLSMREDLELYATKLGFSGMLAIDSHNAMGKQLSDSDRLDLLTCSKQCLEQLKSLPQQEFRIGFSRLEDISFKLNDTDELGEAGLALLILAIKGENYCIAWADSNNMDNKLRDHIISKIKGFKMLEICTSDTHSTSGKRAREGYFALGTMTNHDDLAMAYQLMAEKAAEYSVPCTFEFSISRSKVKVMGTEQFEDYSIALDKSMNVTKIFLGITIAAYIAMLILA